MKTAGPRLGSAVAAFVFLWLVWAPGSRAQILQQPNTSTNMQNLKASQDQLNILQNVETHTPIDPKETAAYQKFFAVDSRHPEQKIKLGTDFLNSYPRSAYVEAVEVGLANAYLAKQDMMNYFAAADRALALNPNEVDVLTTYGWVIPHVYDPKSPDATRDLDRAEKYEKHALDLLDKMKKSDGLSESDFSRSKAQKLQQAHSALGLIYFRRGDYANSASELQQSAQSGNADQTDVFVLGVDLQHLNRHADAAAAFTRCSQVAGQLQDRCKQNADDESKLAHGGM
jgi:tetratricopeptide (TPR) repeat protein